MCGNREARRSQPNSCAKVRPKCADRKRVTTCSAPPFALRATPDDVVRQLRHLPSAPRVLPKLKRLLSDGNSSIHEIVALVRLDPGIAARVLQVGNSAFFSQGLRCYTVDEAVHRVGYDQIYELVATAVASQVLVRPLSAYGMEADQVWQSSIACAIAAECLAERLNIDRDIAYTVGLLHRVGLVAINEWISRRDPDLRFESTELPLETCEHERRVLGFHNAEAGAALLRLWEFPAVMAEPVRWRYLPDATAAHVQLATLLHLAKWVRTAATNLDAQFAAPEPLILRRLATSPAQLARVVSAVKDRLSAIGELLEDAPRESTKIAFPAGERAIVPV
ncbi:MAG: hypothetical protein C0518_11650 [Opitutus sp.]|nr:hypothetical protein [Opitutus sp.]